MRPLVLFLALCSTAFAQFGLRSPGFVAGTMVPPPTTGLSYYSAVFDGTAYLTRGAQLDGVGDYLEGTISFWCKIPPTNATTYIAANSGEFMNIALNSSGQFFVQMYSSAGSLCVSLNSGVTVTNNVWKHILASWNCVSSETSSNHIYIDGVKANEGRVAITNSGIDWTRANFSVGATTGGSSKFRGSLCEFALYTNYVDCSVQAVRERFRTPAGKPANLGVDGSAGTNKPVVYLKSQVPNWEVNAGSGGGLTENGTLVDGGADIP